MKAVALCPTYKRPLMLRQSVWMFREQSYVDKVMVILDDGPGNQDFYEDVIHLVTATRRPSLPEKYNELASAAISMLGLIDDDILMPWEDDDWYFSRYMSSHVTAMLSTGREFSKPSSVLVDTQDEPVTVTDGRYHGSIAFTVRLFKKVGGWPVTKRADFDRSMISRLCMTGCPADPAQLQHPQYMFRMNTGHYHGSDAMKSPEDETWYEALA